MQLSTSIVPAPTTALIPAGGTAHTVALQPYTAAGMTTTLIPVQMMASPPQGAPAPATAVVSISDVIDYVRSYWKRGLLVAAPVAALAFFFLGFGTPVYEAESMLKINLQDSQLANVSGQGSGGFSELSVPMIINNHRTGLKSRRYVDYLFNQLSPSERTAFIGETGTLGLKSRIFIALGISSPPKAVPPEELFAAKIDKAVRIEPVKESHILRIQLRDSSSQRAAELANQYVNFYIDYVADDNLSGMKNAYEVLQKESADLRTRLEEKQQELSQFRKGADILEGSPTGEMNTQRVESLVRAVTEAEVQLIKASIDLNEMRRAQAGGDAAGVKGMGSDQQIIELRKLRDEISTKRSALLEWCGRNHPKVVAFDIDLQRMAEQERARVSELVSAAESEESRLRNQYDQLRQQLATARGEVFDKDPKQLQSDFLKFEANADRDLYNQVLTRMKQTALATRFRDTAQLSVADVAVPPEVPVSPR